MRVHKRTAGVLYRHGAPVRLEPKQHSRRRLGYLIAAVIIVVVVAVRIISAPAQGHQVAVDQKLQPKQAAVAPLPPASTVQSSYFHLALPVGYQQQGAQPVQGLLYDQTIIKPSALGSLLVSIGVSNNDDGLANNPSYRLRQSNPARFSITTKTIHGDTVSITNDNQSAAVAAFWPHGDYLATIAVSSGFAGTDGDNSDELAALLSLLSAWQWQ
jgi:hypothetical protein